MFYSYHLFLISTLVDWGIGSGSSSLAINGSLNDTPNIIAVPGVKFLSLFIVSMLTLLDILLIIFKSFGWNILNVIKLEHWDKAVVDNSLGLWVIKPNITPYFLPSLVIRSKIL